MKRRKFTDEIVLAMHNLSVSGKSDYDIAKIYGIHRSHVNYCLARVMPDGRVGKTYFGSAKCPTLYDTDDAQDKRILYI